MKKTITNNGIIRSLSGHFSTLKLLLKGYVFKKVKARFLYLEVTHRCNLRCIACYTGAGVEKNNALTLDEQKSVVRQAREMGARSVSLSGSGEPLLYKHLFELIDYIRQLGMAVIIFTNGTLIDDKTAAALVERQVLVFFKLYSLEPDVFDQMVGRDNAYEWVEYQYKVDGRNRTQPIPSGLKALLEAQQASGRSDLVKVETLITKMNVHTLPNVALFCRDAGIGFFMETPVFRGRAIQNYDQVALNAAEYKTLNRQFTDIWGREYMAAARDTACSVEHNPVVWTDGRIGFCSSRPCDIGNVRNQSLKSLFLKAQILKRKEDRAIEQQAQNSCCFRTCHSRQQCQCQHNLPCDD